MNRTEAIVLRAARSVESQLLTDVAARSKAYWPYDKEYLSLSSQVTRVSADEIRDWHFTVAERDGKILGFSGLAPVGDELMLDHLWIEPDYIGQGIGRALFADAVQLYPVTL